MRILTGESGPANASVESPGLVSPQELVSVKPRPNPAAEAERIHLCWLRAGTCKTPRSRFGQPPARSSLNTACSRRFSTSAGPEKADIDLAVALDLEVGESQDRGRVAQDPDPAVPNLSRACLARSVWRWPTGPWCNRRQTHCPASRPRSLPPIYIWPCLGSRNFSPVLSERPVELAIGSNTAIVPASAIRTLPSGNA